MHGYRSVVVLSEAEVAALPLLARGAALRFLLTRAHDWVHTPADALVTRKNPAPFLARLLRYRAPDAAGLFAAVARNERSSSPQPARARDTPGPPHGRAEARVVGKECVSTCIFRG